MPREWEIWLGVTFLVSVAVAFYIGVVIGAHTMAGKRVVLERVPYSIVGPHENDGYGVDR